MSDENGTEELEWVAGSEDVPPDGSHILFHLKYDARIRTGKVCRGKIEVPELTGGLPDDKLED